MTILQRASSIVADLGIDSPSKLQVEAIAWYYGLWVYDTPFDGAEGCMIRTPYRNFVLVRNGLSPEQRRLTIAHEIGHYLLHESVSLQPCNDVEGSYTSPVRHEREAEEFAVTLLLPSSLLSAALKASSISINTIRTISREFQTTLTTTAIRSVELSTNCAVVISDGEKVIQYKVSDGFPPFLIKKGLPIPMQSSIHMALQRNNVIPVRGEGQWRSKTLKEESLKLGRYGKVLTLLSF